jgi:hypothetical protein
MVTVINRSLRTSHEPCHKHFSAAMSRCERTYRGYEQIFHALAVRKRMQHGDKRDGSSHYTDSARSALFPYR